MSCTYSDVSYEFYVGHNTRVNFQILEKKDGRTGPLDLSMDSVSVLLRSYEESKPTDYLFDLALTKTADGYVNGIVPAFAVEYAGKQIVFELTLVDSSLADPATHTAYYEEIVLRFKKPVIGALFVPPPPVGP